MALMLIQLVERLSLSNNATNEKIHAEITNVEVGKAAEIEGIAVETVVIAGVEIIVEETEVIKIKVETIGNAQNAAITISRGEILAIVVQQNVLPMQVVVATEVVTVEEIAEVTEVVAVAGTKEIVVATEVVTVEVTVVMTVEEIAEVNVAMTEEVAVVATEVVTGEEIAEVTEVAPQNPAIGVIVAIAEVEIEDKSVGDIAQRLTQIIHLGAVITNHTVRPHSVQYNSFLRSSFFILNE